MDTTAPRSHVRGFQATITPAQWRELLLHRSRRTFRSGTRLLDQGAPGIVVHILLEGRVRIVYTEEDGNEVLVAIRGPGDLLGEYAQRDHGEHMASVWTLEECKTAVLTTEEFEGIVDRGRLAGPLQHYMLGKARQVGRRIWRAANLNTEQRMALLVLELADAVPGEGPRTVPMTQAQVAASLGVSLSSVTSILKCWRESGLVRTHPSPMRLLDIQTLSRRANPD